MMARIWDDSCGDLYDTAHLLTRWSIQADELGNPQTGYVVASSGIAGATGNCLLVAGQAFSYWDTYLRTNLPSTAARLIVGLRWKCVSLPSSGYRQILGFWDGSGAWECGLYVDSSGRLSIWRDYPTPSSAQVGGYTSTALVQPNNWCHIQLDMAFATSGAAFTLKYNSQTVLTGAGLQTANNANPVGMVSLHAGKGSVNISQHYFDDLWINDTTTAVNNSFDGDIQGLVFLPTAPGRLSGQAIGGSAPAGTNWQSVNQAAPDDDVTYVNAASTGLVDTYKVASLPANVVSIVSVTTILDAKTDTAGLGAGATIRPKIGNGATEAAGANVSLNTSYIDKAQYFGLNPLTAAAWALGDWPNIEIGHERTA